MAVKKRPAKPRTRSASARQRSESPAPTPGRLTRRLLEELMFGSGRVRRFTQDSPVLPDVWLDYAGLAGDDAERREAAPPTFPFPPVKLLLTPFKENAAGDVRTALSSGSTG